jgi:hypothetical protein
MWRDNCITKIFNQILSTNGMGKWFLIINKPKFLLNLFSAHYPFCKDLWPKKIGGRTCIRYRPFFVSCLLNGLFRLFFISSPNFLTISPWFTSTCFFKWDISSIFFFVPILHDLFVYCNATYNTWLVAL